MSLISKLIGRKCFLSNLKYLYKLNHSGQNLARHVSGKTFNIKKNEYNVSTSFGEHLIEFNLNMHNVKIGTKKFPYIWLRDNCKCSKCFNYETHEVDIDMAELSIDSKPVQIIDKKDKVEIKWNDGHISEYDIVELTKYALNNELNANRKLLKPRVYWNKEILQNNTTKGFVEVNYKDYVNEKTVLEKAIESIYKYGAVIVNGVPRDPKEMINLCKPIGSIQPTVFGDDFCVVTNKSDQFSDRAYSNLSLRAHTDNVYLKNNSGLECFHVINKPNHGGHSLLIDAFYCAQVLKKQHKEDYDLLSKTYVQFEFSKEGEFCHKYFDKHITENPMNNELYQIKINTYHKVNLCHLNPDQLKNYYRAIKNFIKIIRDPNNECWINLKEDQVLIFDNFRLMHGRSEIDGFRTLVTAYLSRDDYLSKLAVTNNINDY